MAIEKTGVKINDRRFIIAGNETINDARSIPNVVFTEPEIASAGF